MRRARTAALCLFGSLVGCTGAIEGEAGGVSNPNGNPGSSPGTSGPGQPGTNGPGSSGMAGPGSQPAGTGTPLPGVMPTTGQRIPVDFGCGPTPAGTPTPRRLTRLTPAQYANAVATALKGRRAGTAAMPAVPTGLTVPLEPTTDHHRFGTYSGIHSVNDFEVRRSVTATEDTARRLVEAVRTGTCWGTNMGGTMFETCADTLIKDKGSILFGRPLTTEEVTTYGGIVRTNAAMMGRDEALGIAFQALLMAPQFLFRPELGQPAAGAAGRVRLTPYEVAAAISYALTDGPADAELWAAAGKAELATPEQIGAQVTRILGTTTIGAAKEFVVQFFELGRLMNSPKANEEGCDYGRERVMKDARLLIDDIFRTSARKDFLKTLLTTNAGYAGCGSYKVYGLAADPKTDTRQVFMPTQRAGLLTHPAFLGAFAGFEETNPVRRGRFVSESLLCRHIPEVPIGVIPKLPEPTPTTQMRDRLAQHSKDPSCAACHALMDPLGLAFETYDHYGAFRANEAGRAVNAAGMVTDVGDASGEFKNAIELTARLAGSATAEACFVRHGFRYFMGRAESDFDACTVQAAAKAYETEGNYVAMVAALFASPSFLERSQ